MTNPAVQLGAQLASTKRLSPNSAWLSSFLDSQRPTTPFQSLVQTASFRLLASDITKSFVQDACFPADISNQQIQERKLAGSIPVQVLGVEDISKSRWEQIEAIEAIERGEGTKGREIIRVTEENDGTKEGDGPARGGVHKLLLQDARGNRVYAVELRPVEGLGLRMSIGCKLLLQDVTAARGTILMEPKCVTVLGGKIGAWHKSWKDNRKAALKRGIEGQSQ